MKFSLKNHILTIDQRGIAAVEFALIAPVFLLVLMGTMDVGHTLYVKTIVEGSLQKAARDSSLQTGTLATNQAAIDTVVAELVQRLNASAVVTTTRRSYYTYSEASVKKPEDFVDSSTSPDNICNNNESYIDLNGNGTWDADGAVGGQGGARDKAVYTVNVKYPRMFPLFGFVPGLPDDIDISASTVLANQPYGEQKVTVSNAVKNCT